MRAAVARHFEMLGQPAVSQYGGGVAAHRKPLAGGEGVLRIQRVAILVAGNGALQRHTHTDQHTVAQVLLLALALPLPPPRPCLCHLLACLPGRQPSPALLCSALPSLTLYRAVCL